ncbi:MAG TPA: hypothetical protein PLL87_05395 [Syntrophorhabdaceae bacterium]|nr:hypothetical protein [Syntrophorhabdaceae bacterium]
MAKYTSSVKDESNTSKRKDTIHLTARTPRVECKKDGIPAHYINYNAVGVT